MTRQRSPQHINRSLHIAKHQLTLTTTNYSPSHLNHTANKTNNLSQPKSQDHLTLLSRAFTRPRHVSSSNLDVLSLACCASLVSDPAPFPGASPLLSKRQTRCRGVLTPWSLTLDSKLVLSVKSTSPVTENHNKHGYLKCTISI